LTGGELTLFLDEDKIEWGDDLRDRIDKAIAETTFFIPIITARYFQSDECRKELIAFSQRATIKKASSLLLPIYYTDVPELSAQDGPTNSTMRLVKEHKWEDWRSLCLEDISSAEYRKGVRHLAERLVGVVRDLTGEQGSPAIAQSETSTSSTASAQVADAEDEEPGLVELLAEGEEAMPEWTKIIGAASPEIEQIGNLAGEAAEQMTVSDAKGGGASGRLKITIGLAEKLKPHADAILTLGQANAAIMVKVGPAISALLERIEADPQLTLQTEGVPEFIDGIKTLAQNGKGAVASLQGFSTSFDQTAKLSRALRPPIRDIQNGLRGFVDAQAIYDEWERRIEDIYTEADSDTEPDAG
jgi:hypothetical protein